MSGNNILEMLKKTRPLSDSQTLHVSCYRLCGSVKDATHYKNLLKPWLKLCNEDLYFDMN